MKYFLDCEFIEDGKTIDLISIGIIAEDGREYYAINKECEFWKASDWVWDNVLTPLGVTKGPGEESVMRLVNPYLWIRKEKIASQILEFIGNDENPEFFGEWCSYDWVVLCQLYGTMMDIPANWPMRCRDVVQYAEDHLGIAASNLPPSLETDGNHNALLGAKTVKIRYDWLAEQDNGLSRVVF